MFSDNQPFAYIVNYQSKHAKDDRKCRENNFSSGSKAKAKSQVFCCGEKQRSQKTGVKSVILLFRGDFYSLR